MEHVEDDAGLRGRLHQFAPDLGVRGEGLVRHHMDPGRDRLEHQLAARLRGSGDDHRIHTGGEQLGQRTVERHVRVLLRGVCAAGSGAGHDARDFHPFRSRDGRGVEDPAAEAKPNDSKFHKIFFVLQGPLPTLEQFVLMLEQTWESWRDGLGRGE